MIAFFRKEGTKFELQKIKDILAEFRVHHDVWFSETSLYEENKVVPTIEKLISCIINIIFSCNILSCS